MKYKQLILLLIFANAIHLNVIAQNNKKQKNFNSNENITYSDIDSAIVKLISKIIAENKTELLKYDKTKVTAINIPFSCDFEKNQNKEKSVDIGKEIALKLKDKLILEKLFNIKFEYDADNVVKFNPVNSQNVITSVPEYIIKGSYNIGNENYLITE